MSDIQEQIKLAHKRAEENDIKLLKEEIKEILDIFKKINEEYSLNTNLDFEDYEIPNIYLKQFLDYITNLQEENERLKKENSNLLNTNYWLNSRIDNAIEFVNEFIQEDYYEKLDEYITHFTWNTTKEDLLNKLKGDNK